jgi:hypothetical protein
MLNDDADFKFADNGVRKEDDPSKKRNQLKKKEKKSLNKHWTI